MPSKDPKKISKQKARFRQKRKHKVLTYFLQSNEYIKIGITNDLYHRITNNRTGNPYPLVCLGIIWGDHEKYLHEKYKHNHTRGEWFRLDPQDLDELLTLEPPPYDLPDPL